jgi:hypothetical protein
LSITRVLLDARVEAANATDGEADLIPPETDMP